MANLPTTQAGAVWRRKSWPNWKGRGSRVEGVWGRTGPRRDGYTNPDQVAVEMIDKVLTVRPSATLERHRRYEAAAMPRTAKALAIIPAT